jgi:dienelactone hydrolase
MLPRSAPLVLLLSIASFSNGGEPLSGTQPLRTEGDLSVQMVEGIDRWLSRETMRAAEARAGKWSKLDFSSAEAREKSLEPKREMLRKMIGAVDSRTPGALEVIADPNAPVAKTTAGSYTVERVRWPVFDGVQGEGLLLRPAGQAKAAVIALPDADQTPEEFAGLRPGVAPEAQFARSLAEQGVLVVVMTLIDRNDNWSGSEKLKRFTNAPHREWIYRQSFEAGRTPVGFEVQKVFAAMDALRGPSAKLLADGAKIGVVGCGEGALVALFAAALDERVTATFASGYAGFVHELASPGWYGEQPIYRNLFGFAHEFAFPELATMIAPRMLAVDGDAGPGISGPPASRDGRRGAAPGGIGRIDPRIISAAISQGSAARRRVNGAAPIVECTRWPRSGDERPTPSAALITALAAVSPTTLRAPTSFDATDSDARQRRTVRELEEFSQTVLRDAERTRKALPLWTKLKPGAEWETVQKEARADFWENVIGKLPGEYSKANPRTRLVHDKEKWRGYEVMLDVQPDVFAWGTLLVPKDLKPGERRPVVVCQHGLEGLPEDTITQDKSERAWNYYKGFAAQLCERGFIVYAPHNPYRGQDKFRMLQRKANPLGLSLFSFIIAQHDVTTRWLASLPFVDPERIGFYGLSYGGKTAMRVPAALERYCLSICSGDFNEWVMKCASNTHPAGYVFTGEWEIWEWDLAHTFNYAEMALLIAPRPFMVERGHDDGVGLDEHVGYEWAKVRRGYDKLGISERAEIEWFDGPHTIHGVGTFKFLHRWLRWPEPK